MTAFPTNVDREHHLDEVVGAYLTAVDAGRTPEPAILLATHPDLANELKRFLMGAERVTRWTAPLRTIAEAARSSRLERVPAGTLFGDYELLDEIGSGGMGVVYRARQRSLNRTVALKMIGGGRLSTAAQRQRFRHEAETVARLDHPRIVPVYEVGEWSADGTGGAVPFFSMKLFEAGSLADCLDRFAADPAAAARMVIEIALAVHHAHQRGVLHRDLKPSNIVLDGDDRPHVADFGLAKRTSTEEGVGEVHLTTTGTLVGTPGYMSPEQALGLPLTTAADVYGLGAILYALLTGRSPFRAGSVLETLEQVRDREPESLVGLNPRVDRDLQAICLKCLAKRPEQRYGSAEAVSADLERWLTGQPIYARPVSMTARLWRWCRRNPLLASLSAAAAVGVIAALTVLLTGIVLISRERDQKETALQAEQNERKRAEAKERIARRAVDDYMRVTDELLSSQPGMTETARASFERALAFYEELVKEQTTDPDVRFRMAQAQHFVGRMRNQMGQLTAAEQAYRRQLDLLKDLVAEFPGEPKYRFDLFHCYRALAITVAGQGRNADELVRSSIGLIKALVRDYPREPNYRDSLAAALIHLAGVAAARGNDVEPEQMIREALKIAEQLDQEYPNKRELPHYANNVAQCYFELGNIVLAAGRIREAEDSCRQAAAIWERLSGDHPREPEEASYRLYSTSALIRWSGLCVEQNRFSEARDCLDRCVPAAERLAREYPKSPAHRTCTWQAYLTLAFCCLGSGQRQEAVTAFRHSAAHLEQLIQEFPGRSDVKWTLAYWLCTFPIPEVRDSRRALQLVEAIMPVSANPGTLGPVYYRAGRWKDSIRELEKGTRELNPQTISMWLFLAMARWQNGNKEKARELYHRTAAWMDRTTFVTFSDRCLRAETAALVGAAK
jgi:serine/threonine-protein kinase